jgi:GNAT superfamily N-acetyltransferase
MEVIPAKLDDVPVLAQLLGVLFAQEHDFQPDPELQVLGLTLIIENPSIGLILVAKEQSAIVGMVNLLFSVSTALGAKVAILEDMFVLPEWRDRGMGSQIIERAIQEARDQGCARITLLTDTTNESAHRFYSRHGFKPSAMLPLRLILS